MYHGEGVAFDPEGLMNSFAAIVQVILGFLVGNYILQKVKQPKCSMAYLLQAAYWCLQAFAGIWSFRSTKNMDQQLHHLYHRPGLAYFIYDDLPARF